MTVQDLRARICVNAKEACLLLGVGESTMKRYHSQNRGPLRVSRNPSLYRVTELERWAADKELKTESVKKETI